MKSSSGGYRVAVVGASSLLGKETLAVLKERGFPISRLVTPVADDIDADLPVLDLSENFGPRLEDDGVAERDLDFAFLAAPPRAPGTKSGDPPFLRSAKQLARAAHCVIIDLSESLAGEPGGRLTIPFLDREVPPRGERAPGYFVSAHPAVIVISSLLLRLAERFPLKNAVALVFGPASEIGPRAIEELQKQTVSLLSFKKVPQAVFGAQLAFNLLPRLGRKRTSVAPGQLESRIQIQLRTYLGDRAPLPALRFVHTPVFHSLAVSLYVETVEPADAEALERVLAGSRQGKGRVGAPGMAQPAEEERIRVRRPLDPAPSQVEAAGSSAILVDALTPDTAHPTGYWIWAAVDNLRLAAVNAVEIAEAVKNSVE